MQCQAATTLYRYHLVACGVYGLSYGLQRARDPDLQSISERTAPVSVICLKLPPSLVLQNHMEEFGEFDMRLPQQRGARGLALS